MNAQNSTIQLFKIAVGVAWIDGKVQNEEHDYLVRLANQRGIETHPEIYPLLNSLKKVTKDECYQLISDYLGPKPKPEKLNQLIEEISGLIYSDGNMDSSEAEVLNDIQGMIQPHTCKNLNSKIVNIIQGYYKKLATL